MLINNISDNKYRSEGKKVESKSVTAQLNDQSDFMQVRGKKMADLLLIQLFFFD